MRFICAILLHLRIETDVRQSLAMMKYACNHAEEMSSRHAPSFIALMQLGVSFMTEAMNIFIIFKTEQVVDVLIKFIYLNVILEVDNYYA